MLGCRILILRPFLAILLVSIQACALMAPSEPPPNTPPRSFFIFFPPDSATMTPEALAVVDRVADEARQIKATAVGIVGYSSSAGIPARNLSLSEERAGAVEAALLAKNVPHEIIVRTYQGATRDLAGPSIEGQRVEIVVSREDRR